MFLLLRYYFDFVVDFIFAFYYKFMWKIEKIQPPNTKIVLEGASSLARQIKTRQITSEEVVRAFITQIRQTNPILNAVVDDRFSEAIQEAQTIDKQIASGTMSDEDFQRQPLLGVPFTAKEAISVKGLSHTLGLVSRKSHTAPFDADVILLLKRAGAIPLGVTNVPQLNGWSETSNPVYGTTNNPYDTRRTVGGSSGGEAAVVSACGSGFGVGTEMGGSVRLPAFMCGLFGHKTCSHLVSLKGIMFNTQDRKMDMASFGIFVRTSGDIAPILKVMVGENVRRLNLDDRVDLEGVKVHYVLDPGDFFVSPFRDEMTQLMLKAVGYLKKVLPQEPHLLTIEELKKDLTNRQGVVNPLKEIVKFVLRRSDFNVFVMMGLLADVAPKENLNWAKEVVSILKNKLLDTLGTHGVLLYPSAPFPASYHYASLFRPFNLNLFNVWNALDFCVTQVPMGLDKHGVPLGLQVVAAPHQDHLTIAVAAELEKAFGGYVPPFELKQ